MNHKEIQTPGEGQASPEKVKPGSDAVIGLLREFNFGNRRESKEKVNNSICKKIYGPALSPYQRLMQSKQIPLKAKQQLRQLYETLNPVKLKAAIALKLKRILQS